METENEKELHSDDKNTILVFDPEKCEFVELTKQDLDSMRKNIVSNLPIVEY